MLSLAILLAAITATAYIRLVWAAPFHLIPVSGHGTSKFNHDSGPRGGAVTSESAICSRVGVDLLKAGGSAADAVCIGETYQETTPANILLSMA